MKTVVPEQVLCSLSTSLPSTWLPEAGFVPTTEPELFEILGRLEPHWLPRPQAETDASFKQWIPYALVQNPQGELAAYPRQGTEARLHGLWSLGIGGHINPQDNRPSLGEGAAGWQHLLWSGLRRELAEEFPGAAAGRTSFLGLIHERLSPVGRVHLGVVFLHQPDSFTGPAGAEIAGLRWIPLAGLGTADWPLERFELWSRLALQLFKHVLRS